MRVEPYNYTTPNWAPLERAMEAAGLLQDTCREFTWVYEFKPGEHSYKHRDTRGYVVLTMVMDEGMAARRVRSARHGWRHGS